MGLRGHDRSFHTLLLVAAIGISRFAQDFGKMLIANRYLLNC
jgi:hypothetical protein